MASVKEAINLLSAEKRDRILKLAAAAFKMEIGERALHPLEAIKEVMGFKKPFHERAIQYVREGIELAKPKFALRLALVGTGAAVVGGLTGATKLYNELKFRNALADLKHDPEVQAEPSRAESIAHLVKRWAPSVAADPQILKGTVKSLLKFPDSYLTHDVAKKLSEVEKEYMGTHGILATLERKII